MIFTPPVLGRRTKVTLTSDLLLPTSQFSVGANEGTPGQLSGGSNLLNNTSDVTATLDVGEGIAQAFLIDRDSFELGNNPDVQNISYKAVARQTREPIALGARLGVAYGYYNSSSFTYTLTGSILSFQVGSNSFQTGESSVSATENFNTFISNYFSNTETDDGVPYFSVQYTNIGGGSGQAGTTSIILRELRLGFEALV